MKHTCPRRAEDRPGPFTGEEDDYIQYEHSHTGILNYGESQCTYCGSVSGDRFMLLVENSNVILGPTDKSYKVYFDPVNPPDPDDTSSFRHGKFYFQHLTVEQKRRFVEMLNNRDLLIGVPGHFYVLPFFIQRG